MQEFAEYPVKQGQKTFLNRVFAKLGRFHFRGKVRSPAEKAAALLMALLGGLRVEELSLRLEAEAVGRSSPSPADRPHRAAALSRRALLPRTQPRVSLRDLSAVLSSVCSTVHLTVYFTIHFTVYFTIHFTVYFTIHFTIH